MHGHCTATVGATARVDGSGCGCDYQGLFESPTWVRPSISEPQPLKRSVVPPHSCSTLTLLQALPRIQALLIMSNMYTDLCCPACLLLDFPSPSSSAQAGSCPVPFASQQWSQQMLAITYYPNLSLLLLAGTAPCLQPREE